MAETHVWQQLNTALQQLTCFLTQTNLPRVSNFIITSTPLCVSLGGSCCVKPIAVLHLTVDGCTSHVFRTYSYNDVWPWLYGSDVTSCVSMQREITVRESHKPPQHRLSLRSMGHYWNFVFKLTVLTVETLSCLQWKPRDPICSCFVTVHSIGRQTTDIILWLQRNFACNCNVPVTPWVESRRLHSYVRYRINCR